MKKAIITLMIIFSFTACDSYVEDVNINPNVFTDAPGELVIGQAELELVHLLGGEAARLAGIFGDQFTGADRQYIAYNNYTITAQGFNGTWANTYQAGFAQAKFTKEKAIESGNVVLEGVAQILMACFAGETTLLYGDVPFSEAGDADNFPNPIYDSQSVILQQIQAILSEAITKVDNATVEGFYGSGIFEENDAIWSEIGHTLKARYYMAAKDYPNALIEAQQGISSSNGDLLSSHATANGGRNLFYQFGALLRGGYLTVEDSHLRKLVAGVTPRLLVTPGDSNRATIYFDGIELNYNSNGYFGEIAPLRLITWLETKLIEAESAARTGGDGLTPFNQVRDYLATVYGGSFPHSTSTGTTLINEILEEKYISLIGQLSVFSDLRRTDNALGIPIKSSTAPGIPERFLYPQSEINANSNFPGVESLFVATPINQ
ncbi:SusD/RagB family nutrient-binding outer membrane lipoprotein [Aquimarina macrocephali]|uniref:SusD/RagB family nutrient-binding outer membrane lipoprotein n=1 Tax=Aquimarina macrocephali TaxID=666563 RepID=UPI003F670F34